MRNRLRCRRCRAQRAARHPEPVVVMQPVSTPAPAAAVPTTPRVSTAHHGSGVLPPAPAVIPSHTASRGQSAHAQGPTSPPQVHPHHQHHGQQHQHHHHQHQQQQHSPPVVPDGPVVAGPPVAAPAPAVPQPTSASVRAPSPAQRPPRVQQQPVPSQSTPAPAVTAAPPAASTAAAAAAAPVVIAAAQVPASVPIPVAAPAAAAAASAAVSAAPSAATSPSPQPTDWVTLNVGGRVFCTTRATLCADPHSKLARMFSSAPPLVATDGTGAYVIDRSPELFAHVLQFLRAGHIVPPRDVSLMQLAGEAEFFELSGLLEQTQLLLRARSEMVVVTYDASTSYVPLFTVRGPVQTAALTELNGGQLPPLQPTQAHRVYGSAIQGWYVSLLLQSLGSLTLCLWRVGTCSISRWTPCSMRWRGTAGGCTRRRAAGPI